MNRGLTRRQFCASALLAPAFTVPAAEAPRKWAILVGVSALKYTPSKSLVGPRNDVPQMREILTGKYGFVPENITTLEGDQSTRTAVVDALGNLARKARAGDFILFYYSGHGVLSPAPPSYPDPNQRFKAFVPHDAQLTHGNRLDNGQLCPGLAIGCEGGEKCDGSGEPRWETLLQNRDLTALLRALPTRDVLVLLDCCHSGIAARGGAVARRWVITKVKNTRDTPAIVPADTLEGFTTISACTADQTAKEWSFLTKSLGPSAPHEGKMGALTYYLLEHLRRDETRATTGAQAFAHVSAALLASDFNQTPEAEGYLSRPLLGALSLLSATPVTATPGPSLTVTSINGKQARVRGNTGTQLAKASVFADTQSNQIVRITASTGNEANADILGGTPQTGQLLREVLRSLPTTRLRVAVTPTSDMARSIANELTHYIGALSAITLVSTVSTPYEVEVEVSVQGNRFAVALYRGQVRLPLTLEASAAKEIGPEIGLALENLLALQMLSDLENPSADWNLQVAVNSKEAVTAPIGSQIALTAHADRDCYLYLVDMDPQGKVTVLFPNRFVRDNRLKARENYVLPAPQLYRLTVQGPAGPEIVKAIATLYPITLPTLAADTGSFAPLSTDAATFAQGFMRDLQRAVTIPENGITPSLAAVIESEPYIACGGWASATVRLQVTNPH